MVNESTVLIAAKNIANCQEYEENKFKELYGFHENRTDIR